MRSRRQSIRTRIIAAFLTFAILQAVTLLFLLILTDVFNEIYNQSYSKFDYEVSRTSRLVQEMFNGARSGFLPVATQMNSQLNAVIEHGGEKLEDYDEAHIENILRIGTEYIVSYLNSNKNVSGAFVILNTDSDRKDCVYIRDLSEVSGIRSNESKLYVRGPGSIAKANRFQLHYLWERKFDFGELDENGRKFFDMPVWASNSKTAYNDLFYWSEPFSITKNEQKAVTLTMPLVASTGEAYGVCGFELSSESIKKNLPYSELGDERSAYVLGCRSLPEGLKTSIINGSYISKLFANETKFYDVSGMPSMKRIQSRDKDIADFICVTDGLNLYNKNSPFLFEEWAVHGFTPEKEVTAYPDNILRSILAVQVVVFAISLLVSYITAVSITNPIVALSKKLERIDPEDSVKLEKIHITEIDDLTSALELSSRAIAASSSRLSTIINMTGVSIGGYEHRFNDDNVYLTDLTVQMFGIDSPRKLPYSEFTALMDGVGLIPYDGHAGVYTMTAKDGSTKWFRIKSVESDFSENVFAMDITSEILDLKRVEYERDHDSLTKMLNRKAFLQSVGDIIKENKYETGALLLIDIDNLKFVNDTYGHDCGDRYICALAEALRGFGDEGGVISRMGGDEFTIYIPSDKGDGYIRDKLNYILERAKHTGIDLPDGGYQALRFSAGISWYPKDASEVDVLVKYADFSMYETKHNIKGTIGEFDVKSYNDKSFSHEHLEALNRILEDSLLDFVYQPIVDAVTGEVFAYEMLMRSNFAGLERPDEILSLAKSQSKLYFVERLCVNKLADVLLERSGEIGERLIFFNSVSSVALTNEDLDDICSRCPDVFKRSVLEITESEAFSGAIFDIKLRQFEERGCTVAIDDFGSGYNSEIMLVKILPSYVKIDMSLVRGIDTDSNKQQLAHNIISYCSSRGIKTIAEGVETMAEILKLQQLGADYFQGFYFAKPHKDFLDIPSDKKAPPNRR